MKRILLLLSTVLFHAVFVVEHSVDVFGCIVKKL